MAPAVLTVHVAEDEGGRLEAGGVGVEQGREKENDGDRKLTHSIAG
jgi:hypothetical protein